MARKYNWKTGCDVEATLSVIGGRWKPVLICRLLSGPKRFRELCRLAPNATERMITTQLRELEVDGVITRHIYAEIPPRVEYEVTKYGKSLHPIILAMQVWGSDFKKRKFAEEGNESSTEGKVHRKKIQVHKNVHQRQKETV